MLAAIEKLDPDQMERMLRNLITLTVRYQTVGRRRTGLLEITSAKVASGIFAGKLDTPQKVWDQYKELVPNGEDFKYDFSRWTETKSNRVRYVLTELEKAEFRKSHKATDQEEVPLWEDLTLEHILPTNPGNEWAEEMKADPELRQDYVHRLGNLCLLAGKPNKDASCKSYAFKCNNVYSQSELTLTSEIVTKYPSWNRKAIEARQKDLAELALLAWPLS